MATRRPVVLVGGLLKELPIGDDLPIAGVSLFTANVSVVPASRGQYDFTLAQASVVETDSIEAFLATNDDWDADDLEGTQVVATAGVNEIFFTILDDVVVGDYTIKYRLL